MATKSCISKAARSWAIFGQVLRARERCARSIAMRAGQALVQIVGHAPTIKRSDLPGLGLQDPGRWPSMLILRDEVLNRSSLSDTLLATSTQTPQELASLNRDVRHLRDAIYSQIGGWDAPA